MNSQAQLLPAAAPRYTPEQQAVIHHRDGHALVAAVAGSGKTETLLGRVEQLLQRGVPAARILCLMYNKAARVSFERRLKAVLIGQPLPAVHTFHGHARRIETQLVRRGAIPAADLASDGDLRPRKLVRAALRAAFKERMGPDAWPDQRQIDDFQRFITLVKAQLGPAQAVAERLFPTAQTRLLCAAYEKYETERKRARWRAFDDLLFDTVPRIAAEEGLAKEFEDQYDHILVDEMQDMNPIQAALLAIRATPMAQVMGVGDDDQCLYEFRGADPSIFISDFERAFPGTTRYTLSRTFRFGHTLALAAGQLIAHNVERIDKLVVAANGTPQTVLQLHQREFAAADLLELREKGRVKHWSEVLILVRYRAQTVTIELGLLAAQIPYEIEGSSGLFETRIIGGLIALLALAGRRWPKAATPEHQAMMLRDLLKLPTLYLTGPQLEQVVDAAYADIRRLSPELRALASQLADTNHQRAIRDRADLLEMLQDEAMAKASADEVLNLYLAGTRMEAEIRRTAFSAESAEEDLSWIAAFRDYVRSGKGTVGEVLDALGIARETADETERVRVTTMHGAKGLQSPIVILPGWASGGFPRSGTEVDKANSGEEGERRLAYVALTRAQQEAHVYTCADPALEPACKAQDIPDGSCKASRYAYEMRLGTAWALGEALLRNEGFHHVKPTDASHARRYMAELGRSETIEEATPTQAPSPPARMLGAKSVLDIPPGSPVVHIAWGEGTLLELVGDTVARVDFKRGGERLILLATNKLHPAHRF